MATGLNLAPRTLQYYISANRWHSEFVFVNAELEFCRQLLDKWFISLLNSKYVDQLKQLSAKLAELAGEAGLLNKQLDDHISQLQLTAENAIPDNAKILADTHVTLEQIIAKFTLDYRTLKKQLFSLVNDASKKADEVAISGIAGANNFFNMMTQHGNKKSPGIKTHWGVVVLIALIIMLLLFFIFNIIFKNPVY